MVLTALVRVGVPVTELLRTCLWVAVLLTAVLLRVSVADFTDAVLRLLYLGSLLAIPLELPVTSLVL